MIHGQNTMMSFLNGNGLYLLNVISFLIFTHDFEELNSLGILKCCNENVRKKLCDIFFPTRINFCFIFINTVELAYKDSFILRK